MSDSGPKLERLPSRPRRPSVEFALSMPYWNKNSGEYSAFAEEFRPDNFLATAVSNFVIAQHILNLKTQLGGDFQSDNLFVDMGCYQGSSTRKIYDSLTETLPFESQFFDSMNVVGIDANAEFIKVAKNKFNQSGFSRVNFRHIPAGKFIPENDDLVESTYAMCMYFVDQTVADNSALTALFHNCYKILKPGGVLSIVRLSQASFDLYDDGSRRARFPYYGHSELLPIDFLPDNVDKKFPNKLFIPDVENKNERGKSIEFEDMYRSRLNLYRVMLSAGFTNAVSYPLRYGMNKENGYQMKAYYENGTVNCTEEPINIGYLPAHLCKDTEEIPAVYNSLLTEMTRYYPVLADPKFDFLTVPLHETIFLLKEY